MTLNRVSAAAPGRRKKRAIGPQVTWTEGNHREDPNGGDELNGNGDLVHCQKHALASRYAVLTIQPIGLSS